MKTHREMYWILNYYQLVNVFSSYNKCVLFKTIIEQKKGKKKWKQSSGKPTVANFLHFAALFRHFLSRTTAGCGKIVSNVMYNRYLQGFEWEN